MKQEKLAQKEALVTEVAKNLKGAKSVIVVDYLGLTVEQATDAC
jgi:Ribosomal protein L10